jgi:hypothetical protein
MGDNSKAMTIEDHLVQRLKSDTLFQVIGDEDSMRLLIEKALREALFKDRVDNSSYNAKSKPSVVIEAAQEQATAACKELAATMMAELLDDEKTRSAIGSAIVKMLPNILAEAVPQMLREAMRQETFQASFDLRAAISSKLGVVV